MTRQNKKYKVKVKSGGKTKVVEVYAISEAVAKEAAARHVKEHPNG